MFYCNFFRLLQTFLYFQPQFEGFKVLRYMKYGRQQAARTHKCQQVVDIFVVVIISPKHHAACIYRIHSVVVLSVMDQETGWG